MKLGTKLVVVAAAGLAHAAGAQTGYPFYGYRWYDVGGFQCFAMMDGDAYPDMLTISGQFSLRVMLNDGQGRFDDSTLWLTPANPRQARLADVNGDGLDDIVARCENDGLFAALLGLGGGAFAAHVDSPAPNEALGLVVAEVSGDAHVDLLTATGSQLLRSRGIGDGTFEPPAAAFAAPGEITALEGAELNGDGRTDLVLLCTDASACVVLRGTDGGGFEDPVVLGLPPSPACIALADADADGRVDLLVGQTNEGSGNPRGVWLFRGDGAGSFAPEGAFTSTGKPGADTQPLGLASGDLSGDGTPDLVVLGDDVHPMLVFIGTGEPDAPFGDPRLWKGVPGEGPAGLADIDLDGDLDLAVSEGPRVFNNEGEGRFTGERLDAPMGRATTLAAGDLNADGLDDIGVLREDTEQHSSTFELLVTDGRGGLTLGQPVALACDARELAFAELDGGAPDVIASDGAETTWLSNLGGAGEQWLGLDDPRALSRAYTDWAVGLLVADFKLSASDSNTADADILILSARGSETSLNLQISDGAGGFTEKSIAIAPSATDGATGDIDLDGDIDMVFVSTDPTPGLHARLNQVATGFPSQTSRFISIGDESRVELADFTGDGVLDAIVLNSGGEGRTGTTIYPGDGTGKFVGGIAAAEWGHAGPGVGDIDGDGELDFALAEYSTWASSADVHVYMGRGGGVFDGPYYTPLEALHDGWQPRDVVMTDIDGDGRDEVAVAMANTLYPDEGGVIVLRGRDAGPPPCDADFNGDGVVDTRDVLGFLNAWAAGDAEADFDSNGTIDTRDVIGFLNSWTSGC